MENLEYLDEYYNEEILFEEPATDFIEDIKQEKEIIVENVEIPINQMENPVKAEKSDVKRAKKPLKRKSSQPAKKPKIEATKEKVKKEPLSSIGTVIKLYAYKDCLGKFDSLIKNPDIPLWFRDGNNLFQKYLRQKCDNEGLFYYSTQIYSCWEDERESEFLELEAEITLKKTINFVVKILDIDVIEDLCINGNFKELGLTPYTNYHYHRQLIEESECKDPNAFTIKLSPSSIDNTEDTLNDDAEDTLNDDAEDTLNDVTEEFLDDETSN